MTTAPLATVRSIKVKLGILVAASVVVAMAVSIVAYDAGVPLLLAFPVTVGLALGVTQLLAVGMTSPLREMTEAARRMARGDYRGRVSEESTDEVGELARAFNQMAAELATVDGEQRTLVATVSHELRTPLAALTAVLENLADGVVPADAAHLDTAVSQARRLTDLVNDLLELSRVDAGVAPLRLTVVPVAELLDETVAELVPTGRAVSFAVDVPPGLTVRADRARLRQLLVNLLDNAVRHGPARGQVRVTAAADRERWRLEIADDGPGVPPEDRERAFERFGTLAADPSSAAAGGTGLGLAIARWVATLHGGTVRFVDPTGGHGRRGAPRRPPARATRPGSRPRSRHLAHVLGGCHVRLARHRADHPCVRGAPVPPCWTRCSAGSGRKRRARGGGPCWPLSPSGCWAACCCPTAASGWRRSSCWRLPGTTVAWCGPVPAGPVHAHLPGARGPVHAAGPAPRRPVDRRPVPGRRRRQHADRRHPRPPDSGVPGGRARLALVPGAVWRAGSAAVRAGSSARGGHRESSSRSCGRCSACWCSACCSPPPTPSSPAGPTTCCRT